MNLQFPPWFEAILRDPETGQPLERRGNGYWRSDGKGYPVQDGILSAVFPESLSGDDGHWNGFYDRFAPFYDLSQRVLGRLLFGINATEAHRDVVAHLGLPPSCRLLEVSPGPGVFQRHLRDRIGGQGELVALDLSRNMLRQCQKRGDKMARLVHGNGQHLPFADNAFDALFHFGGVNLFNDPGKAIREFVRVVKPGGIVSWGDEGLSPAYPHPTRKKILTALNPGYLRPRPAIPETVGDVKTFEVYGGMGYLVVGRKQ